MNKPLMPTATAVWLIDNTSLTFEQIADFCGLHKLEVEGIANEDVAYGVKGFDPIASGQLTLEIIERCQKDSNTKLELDEQAVNNNEKKRRQPRYTPVSRRRDRPDAIAWLLRNHPEISDGQVSKLIGTTKSTISTVRDRTHWNAPSIKPVDPVSLGLCSQKALDEAVQLGARRLESREKAKKRAERRAEKQMQEQEPEQESGQAPEQELEQEIEQEQETEMANDNENNLTDGTLEENG